MMRTQNTLLTPRCGSILQLATAVGKKHVDQAGMASLNPSIPLRYGWLASARTGETSSVVASEGKTAAEAPLYGDRGYLTI